MNATHLAAMLIACQLSPGIHAQVYSWKDAGGKIHYGDRPPVEQKTESRKLAAPPPETTGADASRKAAADRQMADREKQQKKSEEAKANQLSPEETQQRAENCKRAKSHLAGIESGQDRFTTNLKGERVALEGAVRDTEIAQAKKAVDSWCNPPKPAAK